MAMGLDFYNHSHKSSLWNPAGAGLPTPTSPDSEKMSTPYSTASGPPPPNSSMGFAQRMAAMPQSHHLGGGGNGWAGSEIFSAAAQLMWNGGFEAKMAEHPGMIKGGLDDGRLDPQQMSLYGQRSNSSASSSPPAVSGPGGGNGNLVVPQPINAASKMGGGQMGGHSHNNANSGGGGGGGGGGGTTGRKYQCKMCPQIFGSKADLQMHTQIHMREAKPYKCSQCNKSFANSSYLSQHTRIHLGIKPYRCEICQRKFTQLSHLQQHVRTHTGDKPYRCRHVGCTKAFSQLSNLQSHSRCHQTDKPYKCNSCYKCFTDETALLEHIPKHKESKHLKTHICQYCGKSYTQETYLAKHMQKHSDRPDKRPPILGALGGNPGGVGNPQTPSSQSAQLSSVAAADAAAAAYWQKMDPYNTGHDRVGDYAQSAGLMAHHRDMMDHRHLAVDDLRHGGHGAGQLGGNHLGYGDFKTSSAFSPIQTGMLNSPAGFAMTGGRGYFPEALPFPKHYGQIGIESKSSTTNLQSNFIALSKIGNYQPGSSDLLHSLKEKTGQVSQ